MQVLQINGLGSAPARHKEICLHRLVQMEIVSEMQTTLHKLTIWQLPIFISNLHQIPLGTQRSRKVFDHSTAFSQLNQTFPVDAFRVE